MKHQLGLATVGLFCIAALTGCSGTAGDEEKKNAAADPTGTTTIEASSLSAQQCAADNPYLADASTTTTTGTLTTEKTWIRAYINEAYLWYDQVPTVDATAADFSGAMTSLGTNGVPSPLSNYFKALKTKSKTSSNALTDQFSFTSPTRAWKELIQSGIVAGYGIEWTGSSNSPPRSWQVAIVQSGSPAASAGLQRGDTLTEVDGVDFVNGTGTANVDTINNGLFPTGASSHTFTFTRTGLASPISIAMTASTSVVVDAVPVATVVAYNGNNVGYLHFTDHIASSESKLIAAIDNFKNQGVTDLVLDLRYNGGGLLYLANEMTYMIAGPTRTNGKYFEKLVYNAKRTTDNAATPTAFQDTSCIRDANYNCTSQQALPTLGLGRVFIIAQGDTCSASESIINGLAGIGVEVILIGNTTCGKPYGFTAKDNCGVSYFPIEFKGANYKGFGDYSDGFTPVTSGTSDTNLIGCPQNDDLTHSLGDTSETMLATALQRMSMGTCLPKTGTAPVPAALAMTRPNAVATGIYSRLSVLRQNRILLPADKGR